MKTKAIHLSFFIPILTSLIILFLLSSFRHEMGKSEKNSDYFFDNLEDQDVWKAPPEADTVRNPFPDEPLVLAQGEELYLVFCASCHGDEGYGDGAAGGALGVQPANFHEEELMKQSDGALLWKLSTGRGSMPPFKEAFSEEQLWQLVVYIRHLSESESE